MSPELGQILRRAKEGTRFRFSASPETEFEVLKLDIKEIDGKEVLVGYHLQEYGPRVAQVLYYGKVYEGAKGEYSEEDIEIVKRVDH